MYRYLLCCAAVILSLVAPAAAVLEATTTVSPDLTEIPAGTEVSVNVLLTFDEEFPHNGCVSGTTSLVSPHWTYTVQVSGTEAMEGRSRGNEFYLHGFALSYPSPTPVTINLTVDGTMPDTGTGTASLISIRLEDAYGELWEAMDEPVEIRRGNPAPTTAPAGGGSLDIRSIPSPALVYVDGCFEGTTPCTITGMAPLEHTVCLEKEGYTPWKAVIRTREDTAISILAVLEKETVEGTIREEVNEVLPSLSVSGIKESENSLSPVISAMADLARQMLSFIEDICRSLGAGGS